MSCVIVVTTATACMTHRNSGACSVGGLCSSGGSHPTYNVDITPPNIIVQGGSAVLAGNILIGAMSLVPVSNSKYADAGARTLTQAENK